MKILIVEDEKGIANFIQQGLIEESYEVHIENRGDSGLEEAISGNYDLLLLDWMLPGKTGIEICQEFKSHFPDTPVIFLTAKDTVKETISGLQSGANDYIKKPFHFAELLERIKVQLRSKNLPEDPDILQIGPIILDLQKHQVLKGSKSINLTQKEFLLLEFLMKNKDKVCERTEIIKQVWDIHFEYNTGVIDVFINALRKKLDISDKEYIHTIRGIGYIAKDE